MRIDSSGNVGIGQTSMPHKLCVNGNIQLGSASQLRSSSSSGQLQIQGGSTFPGGNILLGGGNADDNIVFSTTGASTSSTERMRITSSGTVNIGNSSTPASANVHLDLYCNSSYDAFIRFRDQSGAPGLIGFDHGSNAMQFYTNGSTEAMRIDSSGRLLVGQTTTSNNGLLCVKGSASSSTAGGAITIQKGASVSGANQHIGTLSFGEGSANTAEIKAFTGSNWSGSSRETYLTFETTALNSAGPSERMRIDSAGRLLVGASSASSHSDARHAFIQTFGNNSGNFQGGRITIGRAEFSSNITNGEILGDLYFTDAQSGCYAKIEAIADGTAGANDYPGRLVFSTTGDGSAAPTERMRISNDGLVRTYGNGDSIISASSQSAGTSFTTFIGRHTATSTTTGTNSFIVYTNGNVQNTNDSYGQISDVKLKENIVDAPSQWNDFKAVRFRKYNFKEETGHETHTQLGVIAQELELTSPGLVYETDKDEEGNDLGTTTKAVKSSVLTKKALVALQEAMDRIETLEAKVATLKPDSLVNRGKNPTFQPRDIAGLLVYTHPRNPFSPWPPLTPGPLIRLIGNLPMVTSALFTTP